MTCVQPQPKFATLRLQDDFHKRVTRASYIAAAIIALSFFVACIVAFADSSSQDSFAPSNFQGLKSVLYGIIYYTDYGILQPINSLLHLNMSSGIFSEFMKTIEPMVTALQTVGFLMLTLYASINVLEATNIDKITPEQFIKVMLKFSAGTLLIINSWRIVVGIISIGNIILDTFGVANLAGLEISTIYTLFDNSKSFFSYIGVFLNCFLPFVIFALSAVITLVTILGRYLRMGMLAVFAPVGLADSYNGIHGGAMKYAKRMLSVAIQGGIIYAVLILEKALMSAFTSVIGSVGTGDVVKEFAWTVLGGTGANTIICTIPDLLIALAAIGAILGSRKWAEQIVGIG